MTNTPSKLLEEVLLLHLLHFIVFPCGGEPAEHQSLFDLSFSWKSWDPSTPRGSEAAAETRVCAGVCVCLRVKVTLTASTDTGSLPSPPARLLSFGAQAECEKAALCLQLPLSHDCSRLLRGREVKCRLWFSDEGCSPPKLSAANKGMKAKNEAPPDDAAAPGSLCSFPLCAEDVCHNLHKHQSCAFSLCCLFSLTRDVCVNEHSESFVCPLRCSWITFSKQVNRNQNLFIFLHPGLNISFSLLFILQCTLALYFYEHFSFCFAKGIFKIKVHQPESLTSKVCAEIWKTLRDAFTTVEIQILSSDLILSILS